MGSILFYFATSQYRNLSLFCLLMYANTPTTIGTMIKPSVRSVANSGTEGEGREVGKGEGVSEEYGFEVGADVGVTLDVGF